MSFNAIQCHQGGTPDSYVVGVSWPRHDDVVMPSMQTILPLKDGELSIIISKLFKH